MGVVRLYTYSLSRDTSYIIRLVVPGCIHHNIYECIYSILYYILSRRRRTASRPDPTPNSVQGVYFTIIHCAGPRQQHFSD